MRGASSSTVMLTGGSAGPYQSADTLSLIHRLGFVQLDSVNAVERAHHLILFSRAPAYRREHLAALHHDEASLFEHWTHDASLVPMEFYPHWRHRFRAAKARIEENPRWQERFGPDGEKVLRNVRARLRREGALMARDEMGRRLVGLGPVEDGARNALAYRRCGNRAARRLVVYDPPTRDPGKSIAARALGNRHAERARAALTGSASRRRRRSPPSAISFPSPMRRTGRQRH